MGLILLRKFSDSTDSTDSSDSSDSTESGEPTESGEFGESKNALPLDYFKNIAFSFCNSTDLQ